MNQQLKTDIDNANKIVFLTGAGISVPSGLPQKIKAEAELNAIIESDPMNPKHNLY